MARKVFYSFHYKPDAWRTSQVRNAGALEGNKSVSDNDWEEITSGGDAAIKAWINAQMSGRSCAVVLIGANTAGRKWIKYEIGKAWDDGKGVVGVYIHGLKDRDSNQATKGRNPLEDVGREGKTLSKIAKAYDPPFGMSTSVYNHIVNNIGSWVEEAIKIRHGYS